MTSFIGRHEELRVLTEAYEGPASAFIPIYGRRRIGKSELILRFIKDRPGVYFLGKKAPAALQIREFLGEAAASWTSLCSPAFPRRAGATLLDAVVSRWRSGPQARPRSGRIPVDRRREPRASLDPAGEVGPLLADAVRQASSSSSVAPISASWSARSSARRAPSSAAGRRRSSLRPFSYREAALFHPRYSRTDQAKTYFLCGGVPLYLKASPTTARSSATSPPSCWTNTRALYREGRLPAAGRAARGRHLLRRARSPLPPGHHRSEIAQAAGQDVAKPSLLPAAAHRARLCRAAPSADRRAAVAAARSATTSRTR